MIEVDEAELELFHDLEYCANCDVVICHSCPDECSLLHPFEEVPRLRFPFLEREIAVN